MINETSNVYSGDDEGFESAPEKVDTYHLKFMSNYYGYFQALNSLKYPEKVIDTSIAISLKVEMLWLIKVY